MDSCLYVYVHTLLSDFLFGISTCVFTQTVSVSTCFGVCVSVSLFLPVLCYSLYTVYNKGTCTCIQPHLAFVTFTAQSLNISAINELNLMRHQFHYVKKQLKINVFATYINLYITTWLWKVLINCQMMQIGANNCNYVSDGPAREL